MNSFEFKYYIFLFVHKHAKYIYENDFLDVNIKTINDSIDSRDSLEYNELEAIHELEPNIEDIYD